jgi:hypothetical protein
VDGQPKVSRQVGRMADKPQEKTSNPELAALLADLFQVRPRPLDQDQIASLREPLSGQTNKQDKKDTNNGNNS